MNFKRICMVLVSLVLVACLLVNVSPIKARAIEPVSTSVALGIAACTILFSAGVIFLPKVQSDLEAIGNAFSAYLYQWGTSAEELSAVDEFINGLSIYDGDPDDDDDWQPRFDIPDLIKRGVALFTASCILAGSLVVEDFSENLIIAGEGNALYNGIELPALSASFYESYPYVAICASGASDTDTAFSHYLCASTAPLGVYDNLYGTNMLFFNDSDETANIRLGCLRKDGSSWTTWGSGTISISAGDSFISGTFDEVLWSNHDIYFERSSLHIHASPAISPETGGVISPYYIGDIPEKVQNGEYDEETLPLPETIYYGNIIDSDLGAVQSIINLSDDLVNGNVSFDQYLEYIAVPEVAPEPEETTPEETVPDSSENLDIDIPAPDIDSDALANVDPNTFLEQLGSYITTPFKWIWTKIETTFETLTRPELWTETIPEIAMTPARWIWEKIETVIAPMLDPETLTRPLPEILASPFQNLWTNISNGLNSLSESLTEASNAAAETVAEAIETAFVPDKDYLSDKIEYIRSKYSFADSLMKTGADLKDFLMVIGQQPPIIYIDLGATRGSYDIGGKIPFVDLTWYSEYKPKMDLIISAFLWMWFIWRMLIVLPSIISGAAGIPGTHDTLPEDLHTWSGFTKQTYSQYDRNHMRFNLNSMKWGRRK